MNLFRTEKRVYTDQDLIKALEPFDLKGKPVLIYSRLMSLGRLEGREAVSRIVDVLQEVLTPQGTLCFPCYTFSAYSEKPFNKAESKSTVGVLGEETRLRADFLRTTHPVYSTTCWGHHAEFLMEQDEASCFGNKSFFGMFSALPDAYILNLGTNVSAVTHSHLYDQRFSIPGRFMKRFKGVVVDERGEREIEFDSCVRDREFHKDKANSLARFDALAEELKLIKRISFGANWIQGIKEADFRELYRLCVEEDPVYFLHSSQEDFCSYYEKNQFDLYHGKLDNARKSRVISRFNAENKKS